EAVDPVSSRMVQQLLRSYAARGGTVILSSHVMELVEGLCDHVALINNGEVAVDGELDAVRQGKSLTDVVVDYAGGAEFVESSFTWLRGNQCPPRFLTATAPHGGAR